MNNQTVRKLETIREKTRQADMHGARTLVDLVLLIDGTGSMQNCLDAVKDRATGMYQAIIKSLNEKNRSVHKFRVKVIIFRDIFVDAKSYVESDYFILSADPAVDESEAFKRFIADIRAEGGGDEPESALEALHRAIQLPFMKSGNGLKGRHIVCLMTDASAHRLDDPQRDWEEYRNAYPENMPRSLESLQAEWETVMDRKARRFILFAPNVWPWNIISDWGDVDGTPSEAGKGISKEVFEKVMDSIGGSI